MGIIRLMNAKKHKILSLIFNHPVSGNIHWQEVLELFSEFGAKFEEGAGSRVGIRMFNERRIFHRPHPSPSIDKGAVASIRQWLEVNGVEP